MYKYFIKTPWWARWLFSSYVWRIPTKEKVVYLSFDDGPHPVITPWVLQLLKKFDAKATFFCIGANVRKHPAIYQQVLEEGHAVGNHTWHHLNGWQTPVKDYLDDVARASELIQSNLFRPPYGKIKAAQAKGLFRAIGKGRSKVIMWDVLSGDFDKSMTPQRCSEYVLKNVEAGSIVVFHDSEKAFSNLENALPTILSALNNEGYKFEKIQMEGL